MEASPAVGSFSSPGAGFVNSVRVTEEIFGIVGDQEIRRFTLENENQLSVQILTYGAIISSLRFPDKNGEVEDIVLGFDSIEEYFNNDAYFGAIIGRVANRIANASFFLDGQIFTLAPNEGSNTVHGGELGFNKYIWEASSFTSPDDFLCGVTLTLVSPDGDQGFPGTVMAQVTYELSSRNELGMTIRAATSKPTPVNIINHSYFNLAGHSSGAEGVYRTLLNINADRYTVIDENLLPTGEIAPVDGTPMDLREPHSLGEAIQASPENGFDHNFVVNREGEQDEVVFLARAVDPVSGRSLEIFSDQPGIQLYTGNSLPYESDGEASYNFPFGKGGVKYYRHGAFCLETQNFPDAVHYEHFPDITLRPGQIYQHTTLFYFTIIDDTK